MALASRGLREHDDGSTSPEDAAWVEASRAAARRIWRDGLLAGAAVGLLGALSALWR